ncbi:MAG: type I restriction enzyme HsdR N-terminal domain-containing protein [Myxococcales bacterium]|nr:type I restriction enzyme HsdR N-terminal domain-containing protein [Myxococcales bacterium]
MIPLQDFDFRVLDDPEFKEDSVREEIVAPLLRALDYLLSGPERVVRSKRLEHPYVALGATQHRVSMVPDYMLYVEDRPTWILDAKSPIERVDDPVHDAQVYSYAIHRDVRVDWYAICNGREFALYHVGDMSPIPRLRFAVQAIASRWGEIHTFLRPGGHVCDRGRLDKDFGILLLRLGMKHMQMHFIGVPLLHLSIGRLDDGLYRISRGMKIEGQKYLASFDFDAARFDQLLGVLGEPHSTKISETFKGAPHDQPVVINVVGDLGEATIQCGLGELDENEQEHFVRLVVTAVSR